MRTQDGSASENLTKPIPLRLAPMLTDFRGNRRLRFRIERVPRNARLTCGRKNGDNSWSLTYAEIGSVCYLPAADATEPQSFAVRVLDTESGETVALFDVPASLGDVNGKQPTTKNKTAERDDNSNASQ